MEQVELPSSLLLVAGLGLIREALAQPQHLYISDQNVPESVDISVNSVENSDHAEFLGVLFKELGGRGCSEPTHNS
ncbi:hypothetical protein C444_09782 [Haloarcula japonica DSM 6131]|uniref:Uncharacterized protein n=1 Tax=Haloarcula japonica (strain ATCC 49778 / DSM 6131 / JCM 7785 / NBRC 101032 / NCIMB 13157 / TR-1) TaxID=1227453 RepID=M0LEQ9_HALJT|nr:hypothetical protein C444_09782 [Haloarcula japonica DSM 6131]